MSDESALTPARHEPTDVSARVIWIGVPALLVSVIGLSLLVLWLFPGRTVDRTMHQPLPRFPSPELQVSPREDMANFRAREVRWLESVGWVDRSHGVVHIPIEDAMRKVAQEGIPDWPTPPAEQPQPASRQSALPRPVQTRPAEPPPIRARPEKRP
jgi:hypothetical protein